MKYHSIHTPYMAAIIVIPIVIVTIVALMGYMVYRYVIRGYYSKRSVERILKKYNIKKTPSQIIREYYASKGEHISDGDVRALEKNYRENEPDQFLAMYDAIRDKTRD